MDVHTNANVLQYAYGGQRTYFLGFLLPTLAQGVELRLS